MIENDILRDVLLEDERVPSTNELAKLYAINPSTAAKVVPQRYGIWDTLYAIHISRTMSL